MFIFTLFLLMINYNPNIADEKNNKKGIIEIVEFESESISPNLLNTTTKQRFLIYLPPAYFESLDNYPVVYFLPGFACPIEEYINGTYDGFNLNETMNKLILDNKIRKMIIVIPNAMNKYGGGFYSNSPVLGNWEDYITNDLVNFIDNHFRTIRKPDYRFITGHSMGGFGACNIAIKFPNIFSHVVSISGGFFDENGISNVDFFRDVNLLYKLDSLENKKTSSKQKIEDLNNFVGNINSASNLFEYRVCFYFAYLSAFVSNLTNSPYYIDFPYSIKNNSIIQNEQAINNANKGFGEWESKILKNKEKISKLKNIVLICGNNDSWITNGNRFLSTVLKKYHIHHNYDEFNGGHDDKLNEILTNNLFLQISNMIDLVENKD